MAGKGPPKTPTKILEGRGSWRGKTRKDEPKAKPGRPARPSWLRKEAKLVWNRLMPLLEDMKVVTKSDEFVLTEYCEYFVLWRKAVEFTAEHGDTYEIEINGNIKRMPQPEASLGMKYRDILGRIEAQFGLSPSARASLAIVPDTKEPSKKERFFGRGA